MVTSLIKVDTLRRRNYEINPITPKLVLALKSLPREPSIIKTLSRITRIPFGLASGGPIPVRLLNSGNSTTLKEYPPILL